MKPTSLNEPIIQPAPTPPKISFIKSYKYCTKELAIEPFKHLNQIRQLSKAPGKISIKDFYYYGLYNPGLTSFEQQQFVGNRLEQTLHKITFDFEQHHLATDKCLFETTLRKAGFPTPHTICLYQQKIKENSFPFATIKEAADLESWLQNPTIYPVYGKPRFGIRSGGVLALSDYKPITKRLASQNGRQIATSEVVASLKRYRRKGYLFQIKLQPHPKIAELVGDSLATVRLILLIKPNGPSVYRAAWKIPAFNNIADNFWRGNVLAGLDIETGKVIRSITGIGLDMCSISHHPDSGLPLLGYQVPEWKSVVSLCRDASKEFPGIDMQAWDIAITDTGPVLMEVNIGGDYCLPQLAHNKGMLEREFVEFLENCAKRRNLSTKFKKLRLNTTYSV